MCFATQLATAGGRFCDNPAFVALGAEAVELLVLKPAPLLEEDTMGAVVGCAEEMLTPEELDWKMVAIPEEGSV